jgi:hypothetical protein
VFSFWSVLWLLLGSDNNEVSSFWSALSLLLDSDNEGVFFLVRSEAVFYSQLAETPGVARVDHRTKCVSFVALSLSHFETLNCWPAL